jgi:hypothetical protein
VPAVSLKLGRDWGLRVLEFAAVVRPEREEGIISSSPQPPSLHVGFVADAESATYVDEGDKIAEIEPHG